MSRKKDYLTLDQVVYKPGGWTKSQANDFIDEFLELVEQFNGQCSGHFRIVSEKDLEEEYDDL